MNLKSVQSTAHIGSMLFREDISVATHQITDFLPANFGHYSKSTIATIKNVHKFRPCVDTFLSRNLKNTIRASKTVLTFLHKIQILITYAEIYIPF
jgi:hypothetical protein